jgi:hypothetical protein
MIGCPVWLAQYGWGNPRPSNNIACAIFCTRALEQVAFSKCRRLLMSMMPASVYVDDLKGSNRR